MNEFNELSNKIKNIRLLLLYRGSKECLERSREDREAGLHRMERGERIKYHALRPYKREVPRRLTVRGLS